jgi:WD40 repeat protein
MLATASKDGATIRLWNVADGSVRRALTGHRDGVWSVQFSPHDRLLVSGVVDNAVRIWHLT